MIRLFIQRLLDLHGIKKGRAFLINHGYTPDEVRGLLSRTPKEISFEMITRLCNTFNCLPNAIMTYDGNPNSHLQALKRPAVKEFEKLIANKTPEEIEEAMKWLEEKLNDSEL